MILLSSMVAENRRYASFGWGLASHVLAALFPYLAAVVLARGGALFGAALIYSAAALFTLLLTLRPRFGTELRRGLRVLVLAPPSLPSRYRLVLAVMLVTYTLSALCYYVSLERLSGSVLAITSFSYLTQLQGVLATAAGLLLLGEHRRARRRELVGLLLTAVATGIILSQGFGWQLQAALFALCYVVLAVAAEALVVRLLAHERPAAPVAVSLFMLRMLVPAPVFLLLLFTAEPIELPLAQLFGPLVVCGIWLPGIFLSRFLAFEKGLEFWRYASLSPVRNLLRALVAIPQQGLTPSLFSAYLLFMGGEFLIFWKAPETASQKRAAKQHAIDAFAPKS